MSALKTSQHGRPTASRSCVPVIVAAARLKEVTRKSLSTVNTPSLMESKIVLRPRFQARADLLS